MVEMLYVVLTMPLQLVFVCICAILILYKLYHLYYNYCDNYLKSKIHRINGNLANSGLPQV